MASHMSITVIIFDDFSDFERNIWFDFPFKVKSSAMKLLTLRDKNEDMSILAIPRLLQISLPTRAVRAHEQALDLS